MRNDNTPKEKKFLYMPGRDYRCTVNLGICLRLFYERNIKKKDKYISTLDDIGLWIDSKINNNLDSNAKDSILRSRGRQIPPLKQPVTLSFFSFIFEIILKEFFFPRKYYFSFILLFL